ncbi:aldehyde dehydrogenase family protein [Ornithinimicrobium sp. LYQ121]|uniref:aldehyde dehydrogenase family protein n=1 Tax=Ornithinimicrobium sp. LYQ121 TaxID=3378801 RepID=UPI003852F5BF
MLSREEIVRLVAEWGAQLQEEQRSLQQILEEIAPASTAAAEIEKTIRALATYASEAGRLEGRRPVGKVFVSLPFNNPLYSFVLYCVGPLLAGNEVICRPSKLTSEILSRCLAVAPIPSALGLEISILNGADFIRSAETGADCLIFTGSWDSAKKIERQYAGRLIYCGPGLNPFVILSDADLATAIPALVRARLFNNGQDCLCAERVYVHAAILHRVTETLVEAVAASKGQVGPLINEAAAERVQHMLSQSHAARHTLLSGNIHGALVEPSIIVTDDDDPLVRAEKFAPVFVIVPFHRVDELEAYLARTHHYLGVTIFGGLVPDAAERLYPHVAWNTCLLESEAEDAHNPFGGRARAGFVRYENGSQKDGPILFSVETSTT